MADSKALVEGDGKKEASGMIRAFLVLVDEAVYDVYTERYLKHNMTMVTQLVGAAAKCDSVQALTKKISHGDDSSLWENQERVQRT